MLLNLSIGRVYGIDSIVELLIIVIASIIAYYSYKIYKLINDKDYRLFSWAFLSLAVSFIFKILSNLTIYYSITIERANLIFTLVHELEAIEQVNFLSLILYKTTLILGFLILFFIITKTNDKQKRLLFIYLSAVAVLFSIYFDFVLHLTAVFLLFSITDYFYQNYKKLKNNNAFLVFIGFVIILVSQIFFIFEPINLWIYLISELLILVGFLCLLINQIKLKHEQKKNKTRSNKRYIGNIKKK